MQTSKRVVSAQFADSFEAVAAHYGLKESGKYEQAKAIARGDLDNAVVCFGEMAKELTA